MHRTNNTELVKLVVIERGSSFCSEAFACVDPVSEVVALVQGEGDTLADLADATAVRLKRLERTGHRVVAGAVMVGPLQDQPARAARGRLAREVRGRLRDQGAELVFHAGPVAREDLLALAEGLSAVAVTGGPFPVKVRCGGGVRAASGLGVSSGNTDFGILSSGSASDLAIGYVGGSRRPEEAGHD